MSAEDNKKIVLSFFENLSAGKAVEALGMLDDNATWTVMGRPSTLAISGTRSKAQFVELMQGLGAKLPKGMKITPKGITAEGSRVALEAESYGEATSGKVYNNQYHFLFEIQNNKIQAVREYLDTSHAQDVLVN
jgi:ketosteroid isomerase-like protein